MLNSQTFSRIKARQRGASAVEFGIIAMLFFTLFFGIIEFGRFFYLYNTVQEVTRCAARQAVVTWKGDSDDWSEATVIVSTNPIRKIPIRQYCLFGHDELVAGWEIGKTNVRIRPLNVCDDISTPADETVVADPGSAADNIAECGSGTSKCIRFVEASLWCDVKEEGDEKICDPSTHRIIYQPNFGLIPLQVNIPGSTVCMPAESLGYGMTP